MKTLGGDSWAEGEEVVRSSSLFSGSCQVTGNGEATGGSLGLQHSRGVWAGVCWVWGCGREED